MTNPWYGHQEFLARVGGPVDPEIENSRLKLGFTANLRGIMSSLYDKDSGRELVALGPAGQPSLGGVRDSIYGWIYSDDLDGVNGCTFTSNYANGVHTVYGEGHVLTSGWYDAYILQQRRTVDLVDGEREFSVKTWLYTLPETPWWIQTYGDYVNLTEPHYEGRLFARLNVWAPGDLKVVFLAPGLAHEHQFALGNEFSAPLPQNRQEGELAAAYIMNGTTDPAICLTTPWAQWDHLSFAFDPGAQQLLVEGIGPKKAAIVDTDVPMSEYNLKVMTYDEANRATPVSGLHATAGDGSVVLAWDAKNTSGVTGYNVYQSTQFDGPYAKLTPTPAVDTTYNVIGLVNDQRYYFYVTVVYSGGKESPASPIVSGVPNSGGSTIFLVANNGAGDFASIQEAFDALPTVAWQNDYTIQVLDTSATWPDGYAGAQSVRRDNRRVPGASVDRRRRGRSRHRARHAVARRRRRVEQWSCDRDLAVVVVCIVESR